MKRRNYKGRELLPLAVSDAARAGDADAMEQVLRYYEGYIGSAPQPRQDKQQKHKAKQSESGPQG